MSTADAFARSGPNWVASSYADVRAVLADDRFEVAEPGETAEPGTITWLRASVSRFSNGAVHQRRHDLVVDELSRLDPVALRADARHRALECLAVKGETPDLSRHVPTATLAAHLGIAVPDAAAAAVVDVAAAYFPGAGADTRRRADPAVSVLLDLIGACDLDVAVARVALLVQGCDATARLISAALEVRPDSEAGWPTDAILREVLRHDPPVVALRRVAATDLDFAGNAVTAGDPILCDVRAANRDPAVFGCPDQFDPGRDEAPSLTFGSGIRPCPGGPQALALAAGVVDAVREVDERSRRPPGIRTGAAGRAQDQPN